MELKGCWLHIRVFFSRNFQKFTFFVIRPSFFTNFKEIGRFSHRVLFIYFKKTELLMQQQLKTTTGIVKMKFFPNCINFVSKQYEKKFYIWNLTSTNQTKYKKELNGFFSGRCGGKLNFITPRPWKVFSNFLLLECFGFKNWKKCVWKEG